jgi:cytochrome oxidase Cu insertion factor (SCO1/SenC/PrrC family)
MRAEELVDQLHEGSDRYAGRSTAAAGRLRASVLAEFAEVGLPAAAVPYVVEVLRTELNPEVVAAAALAVRGWPGSDPELAAALVQAMVNLRGHDGPIGPGTSRTALVEVLAALAWQPSVPDEVMAALERLSREHGSDWSPEVRRALAETLAALRGRARLSPLVLSAASGPMPPEPSAGVGDLGGVVVEDQDGVRLPLVDFLGRADTVVAFFYTRCQNPNKCSLTITKLADLQARMIECGLGGQLAAISYDPGFDLPPRLAAYGRARGLQFGHSVRMFRAVAEHSRLAEFFGLRVGYTGTIVNQHGLELYLVDAEMQIVQTWARIPWEIPDVLNSLEVRA